MTNKNPPSRVVNIPTQFMPLVEKEREDMGCFTTCDCMGRILADYFSRKGRSPSNNENKQVIKGVKVNG